MVYSYKKTGFRRILISVVPFLFLLILANPGYTSHKKDHQPTPEQRAPDTDDILQRVPFRRKIPRNTPQRVIGKTRVESVLNGEIPSYGPRSMKFYPEIEFSEFLEEHQGVQLDPLWQDVTEIQIPDHQQRRP